MLIAADVLGVDAAGWQAIAAVVGTPLVVGSLVLLIIQSRRETETTRASVHQSITDSMLEIDRLFFENPRYRRYFYDGVEPPTEEDERTRVVALAEMLLDFVENCLVQEDRLGGEMAEDWREYAVEMLDTSPAMCALRAEHVGWWAEVDEAWAKAQAERGAAAAETASAPA